MRKHYQATVKEQILKTVESLLKKEYCEDVTIRSVAQHLGVAVGSIYTYFPDKNAILREIYRRTCKDFLTELQEAPQKYPTPEENFINLIVLACTFRIKNSYRYRKILYSLEEEPPEELKAVRAFIQKQLSDLKLKALSTSNELVKAERSILALCEGIAMMTLLQPKLDTVGIITFALRSLIAGWKTKISS